MSQPETSSEPTKEPSCYMPPSLLPPPRNLEANSTLRLSRLDVQRAINDVKRFVERRLESDLHLIKHTAPLAFLRGTGVNDELDGTESKRAVTFTVPNQDVPRGIKVDSAAMAQTPSPYQMECEVVQSLAKWKRIMLQRLECPVNTGIYCDSTSIRKGYKGDVTHSVIADQWGTKFELLCASASSAAGQFPNQPHMIFAVHSCDTTDFEIRLTREQRTMEQIQTFVRILWKILTDAEDYILDQYPAILLDNHPTASWRLPKDITFVTSQELHDMFPDMDVHGRENAAVEKWGAMFLMGMGWPMTDGSEPEEVRSPGYDDWNLNGDILVRHPLTEYRHEISSMGIRVDQESLLKQLDHRGVLHEQTLPFFQAILNETIPLSYGGGLGISRLLMLLLRTAHIGEVQVGLWHDAHYQQVMAAGIDLIPDRIISAFGEDPN